MIIFRLPWPPTVNTYWRHWHGKTLLSKAGRVYRQNVLACVLEQHGKLKPIAVPCCVEIVATPPDKRKRDLDNLLKGILDGLTYSGAIADDSLIDRLTILRGKANKGAAGVYVELWEKEDHP